VLNSADRVIGLVIVAGGVGLAAFITGIEINKLQSSLSARFFPSILAGALIIFGAGLALRPGDARTKDVLSAISSHRGLLISGIFLAYCLAFPIIDFRLGTWLFTLASLWILGSRSWIELLVIPIAVSGIVFVIFRFGFTVLLPTWT
jgi:putative tricarboxylic transport membrane protein